MLEKPPKHYPLHIYHLQMIQPISPHDVVALNNLFRTIKEFEKYRVSV